MKKELDNFKKAVNKLKRAIFEVFEPLILFIINSYYWFVIFVVSFFVMLILIGILDVLNY